MLPYVAPFLIVPAVLAFVMTWLGFRESDISLNTAALAIAIGILSNTALELAIATFFGTATFRRVAAATLFVIVLAAGAAVML